MVRALAIEAFYSDFVAPGADGPGAWEEIDFDFPLASRIKHDWSYHGGARMSERVDVVVVGSGPAAAWSRASLRSAGANVVLLEAGPHLTAADFVRWEAKAAHDFWWPLRHGDGRRRRRRDCADLRRPLRRRDDHDQHEGRRSARTTSSSPKWHEASGLLGDGGEPFGVEDLAPHYERVETVLGRPRARRLAGVRADASTPASASSARSSSRSTPTRTSTA